MGRHGSVPCCRGAGNSKGTAYSRLRASLVLLETPGNVMGIKMHSRQSYEGHSQRAVILHLLKRKDKFQFAVARILGLSGKVMRPVTH